MVEDTTLPGIEEPERLFTRREAQTQLGVSERTLFRYLQEGRLQGRLYGGRLKFTQAQIDDCRKGTNVQSERRGQVRRKEYKRTVNRQKSGDGAESKPGLPQAGGLPLEGLLRSYLINRFGHLLLPEHGAPEADDHNRRVSNYAYAGKFLLRQSEMPAARNAAVKVLIESMKDGGLTEQDIDKVFLNVCGDIASPAPGSGEPNSMLLPAGPGFQALFACDGNIERMEPRENGLGAAFILKRQGKQLACLVFHGVDELSVNSFNMPAVWNVLLMTAHMALQAGDRCVRLNMTAWAETLGRPTEPWALKKLKAQTRQAIDVLAHAHLIYQGKVLRGGKWQAVPVNAPLLGAVYGDGKKIESGRGWLEFNFNYDCWNQVSNELVLKMPENYLTIPAERELERRLLYLLVMRFQQDGNRSVVFPKYRDAGQDSPEQVALPDSGAIPDESVPVRGKDIHFVYRTATLLEELYPFLPDKEDVRDRHYTDRITRRFVEAMNFLQKNGNVIAYVFTDSDGNTLTGEDVMSLDVDKLRTLRMRFSLPEARLPPPPEPVQIDFEELLSGRKLSKSAQKPGPADRSKLSDGAE